MTEPAPAAPSAPEPGVEAPRWGLGDALLAFMAGMVGTVVMTGVYLVASGESNPSDNDTGLIAATLLGLWAGMFGVAWRASRRKGSGSLGRDYGMRIVWRDVPVGIVVGLASQFLLVSGIIWLFGLIDNGVEVESQAKQITGGARGLQLLLLAPLLCVGAPFFEELYFRGLLLRSAVRRLGAVGGIFLASLAFGLVHYTGELNTLSLVALITALGSFGAVLNVLAHRFGRLGPALVAHATFNAVTVIALAAAN